MFSDQMRYTANMTQQLRRMVQFLSLLYVPAWLSAALPSDAPRNDLQLFQSLLRYREVDKAVANAALSVMRRHMAYLRPETVVLSLASSAVTDPEKRSHGNGSVVTAMR